MNVTRGYSSVAVHLPKIINVLMLTVLAIFPAVAKGQTGEQIPAPHHVAVGAHTRTTPFSLSYDRFSVAYGLRFRPAWTAQANLLVYERPLFCLYEDTDLCYQKVVKAPLEIMWLSDARSDHHLVVGTGVNVGYESRRRSGPDGRGGPAWSIPLRLGYRFQPMDGGLTLDAAYTPSYFGTFPEELVQFTLAAGYSF